MKRYKYIFPILMMSYILVSCSGTSEEELVGDWERRSVFMDCGRAHSAYFVIGNLGYVVGGTNGNREPLRDVYVFDPTAGSLDRKGRTLGDWDDLNDLPPEMPARQQAVGFSLNGKGYMGTGFGFVFEVDVNGVYILDVNGNKVRSRDPFTMRDFWCYDPATDTWTEVAPLPPTARNRRAAIAFSIGGYGYIGCGFEDEPGRNFLADFWRFDPDGTTPNPNDPGNDFVGAWESVRGFSGAKRAGATVFVIDNKAYISTGTNSGTLGNITDFYMFDPNAPEAARWTRFRQMDNANPDEDYDDDYATLKRAYGVGYTVSVGGQTRGHIVGGSISTNSTNWEYDHEEDLWMQRTSFFNRHSRQAREGMISFSFPNLGADGRGRGFVGLGRSGIAFFDEMWEFYPLEEDYIYNDNQ